MRRNFAFNASSSAINSTRRASSQPAISASSCAIVSGRGRRNAIRRAIASRTVRLTEIFAGEPEVEQPARRSPSLSASASFRLARSGNSRSSRNRSTNSSRLRTKRNASSPSPSPGLVGLPPLPSPERGSTSPSTNFLLPGSTMSRVPPSQRKRGSLIPSSGMPTSPPSRTSLMSRPSVDFLTAPFTSALARRKKRWRFSRLLLPGFRRRSTMCIATFASASSCLFHAHVPFDESANLTLGITASHHALDKLAVLLFGIAVLFRAKRDNRKQVFGLRAYPPVQNSCKGQIWIDAYSPSQYRHSLLPFTSD